MDKQLIRTIIRAITVGIVCVSIIVTANIVCSGVSYEGSSTTSTDVEDANTSYDEKLNELVLKYEIGDNMTVKTVFKQATNETDIFTVNKAGRVSKLGTVDGKVDDSVDIKSVQYKLRFFKVNGVYFKQELTVVDEADLPEAVASFYASRDGAQASK